MWHMLCLIHLIILIKNFLFIKPVGFVTFSSRVDAESAKQELTVNYLLKLSDLENYLYKGFNLKGS